MVRITREKPESFSSEAITVLNLLGVVIADHPDKVNRLLAKYQIKVDQPSNPKEITSKVLHAIEQDNKRFNQDIAKLIMAKVDDDFDSFTDPISAVTGAVGSIANIFGNKQQQKMMKEQARSQTLSAMLAYRSRQAEMAAASKAQEQKHTNKMAMIKTVGVIAILALIGLLFFRQMQKKSKPSTQ